MPSILVSVGAVLTALLLSINAKYIPVSSPRLVGASGTVTCVGAGSANSSAIEMGNCEDDQYYIQMKLGSNEQTFDFLFDTGSDDLWIPLIGGGITSGFNSSSSSTYNTTGSRLTLTYADNSEVSGQIGYDTITITGTNISTTGQILFADEVQGSNLAGPIQGLVGMGYTTLNNFLDDAYSANQISTSSFALDLAYDNATSYLYYDNGWPTGVLENTTWINQYETGHWQLQLIGVFVGGQEFTKVSADMALIDSGTSLFYLNQEFYNQITDQFFSACSLVGGFNVCPCSTQFPDFSFMFIGAEVYLNSSQYVSNLNNGSCQANFGSLSTVSNVLLGDTFFRKYTISFSKLNSQIGFYGELTPIYITGEDWLKTSQYVIAVVYVLLLIFGLWASSKVKQSPSEANGLELDAAMQASKYDASTVRPFQNAEYSRQYPNKQNISDYSQRNGQYPQYHYPKNYPQYPNYVVGRPQSNQQGQAHPQEPYR